MLRHFGGGIGQLEGARWRDIFHRFLWEVGRPRVACNCLIVGRTKRVNIKCEDTDNIL